MPQNSKEESPTELTSVHADSQQVASGVSGWAYMLPRTSRRYGCMVWEDVLYADKTKNEAGKQIAASEIAGLVLSVSLSKLIQDICQRRVFTRLANAVGHYLKICC
jgi:hypothetical protein